MTTPTVLIVDDSRMSRMLLNAIVMDVLPTAQVIEADSGEQALQKIAGRHLDFASVDMNMPGMDGLSLCRELARRFPHARLGLTTADLEPELAEAVRALGVEFIPKPITEHNLGQFLRG